MGNRNSRKKKEREQQRSDTAQETKQNHENESLDQDSSVEEYQTSSSANITEELKQEEDKYDTSPDSKYQTCCEMETDENTSEELSYDNTADIEEQEDIYRRQCCSPAFEKEIFQTGNSPFSGTVSSGNCRSLEGSCLDDQKTENQNNSRYAKGEENHCTSINDVCKELKESDPDIKTVYATYREENKERNQEATKFLYLQEMFSEEDEKRISACIRSYGDDLMKKHSNLSLISASSFKSIGFGKQEAKCVKINCIVCYCMFKGYIPYNEEPFPKTIGDYIVDIREGSFNLAVGEKPPTEFQPTLRSGAAISGIGRNCLGSIGPIFDHPRDGYLAFGSSAHVFLSDEEIAFGMSNGTHYMTDRTINVEQPPRSGFDCGSVVKMVIREGGNGEVGVDACIIKISDRWPNSGYFPEHEEVKLMTAGFCPDYPPRFDGKIECDVDSWRNQDLLKYGCMTRLTRGVLHLRSVYARRCIFSARHGRCSFNLFGQFEILPVSFNDDTHELYPFAEPGDSGSLVFSRNENDELRAIGVVTGVTDYGTTIVTPIKDYLCALNIGDLTTFKQFSNQPMDNRRTPITASRVTSGTTSSGGINCVNFAQIAVSEEQTNTSLATVAEAEDDTEETLVKTVHGINSVTTFVNGNSRDSFVLSDNQLNSKADSKPRMDRNGTEMKINFDFFTSRQCDTMAEANDILDNIHFDNTNEVSRFSPQTKSNNDFLSLSKSTTQDETKDITRLKSCNTHSDTTAGNDFLPFSKSTTQEQTKDMTRPKCYNTSLDANYNDEMLPFTENVDIEQNTGIRFDLVHNNQDKANNQANNNASDTSMTKNGLSREKYDFQNQNYPSISNLGFQVIKQITADTMHTSYNAAISDKATDSVKKTLIRENSSLGQTAVREVATIARNHNPLQEVNIICPKCGRNALEWKRKLSKSREHSTDCEMRCLNCSHTHSDETVKNEVTVGVGKDKEPSLHLPSVHCIEPIPDCVNLLNAQVCMQVSTQSSILPNLLSKEVGGLAAFESAQVLNEDFTVTNQINIYQTNNCNFGSHYGLYDSGLSFSLQSLSCSIVKTFKSVHKACFRSYKDLSLNAESDQLKTK